MSKTVKHECFDISFNYKGRTFIVDKMDSFWLITESKFIIRDTGKTLKEAKLKIKKHWDKVSYKYKKM